MKEVGLTFRRATISIVSCPAPPTGHETIGSHHSSTALKVEQVRLCTTYYLFPCGSQILRHY